MHELDFDGASLRDWLAGVGLLRLVTETTPSGTMVWRKERGRHRLYVEKVPDDFANLCVAWVAKNRNGAHPQ